MKILKSPANNKLMSLVLTLVSAILFFDAMTAIIYIYIAPDLEVVSTAEVLLYLKLFIALAFFIILLLFKFKYNFNLSKEVLQTFLVTMLVMVIFYFFYLYIYKYFLLIETIDIIKYKIIDGNSSLAVTYSLINLQSLSYVTSIFSGAHSELILFSEALLLLLSIFKVKDVEVVPEKTFNYDTFLFKRIDIPLSILLLILSFLSIRIINIEYEYHEVLELVLGIIAFSASIFVMTSTIKFNKISLDMTSTVTYYRSYVFIMIASSIIACMSSSALFIYHLISLANGEYNYRTIPSFITLVLAFRFIIRSMKLLNYENKS